MTSPLKRAGKVILALNRPPLPQLGEETMDVDDEITISENLISDSQSSLAGLGIFEDSQPSFESLGSQSPAIPDVVSTPQFSHNEHSHSQPPSSQPWSNIPPWQVDGREEENTGNSVKQQSLQTIQLSMYTADNEIDPIEQKPAEPKIKFYGKETMPAV